MLKRMSAGGSTRSYPSANLRSPRARWLPHSGAILPGALFRVFEPMYSISEETTRQFSRFMSLQSSSLVFVHVNLPHPPGDYSQRTLRFTTVADDREAYRRNLRLADDMIGTAIAILRAQSKTRDILLVVSSDHWHRIDSPHLMQPIPWIAWHLGENAGAPLERQINTVHTAQLCLDFLAGTFRGNVTFLRGGKIRASTPHSCRALQ